MRLDLSSRVILDTFFLFRKNIYSISLHAISILTEWYFYERCRKKIIFPGYLFMRNLCKWKNSGLSCKCINFNSILNESFEINFTRAELLYLEKTCDPRNDALWRVCKGATFRRIHECAVNSIVTRERSIAAVLIALLDKVLCENEDNRSV